MNSGLTSGLSAPESRCRRTCRRTASLRFASARRRRITSTVTSHGPQSEQSSCTVAAKGRTDPVRPQKRHKAITESLTRLIRSPLLTAGPFEGRRHACHAPLGFLKNPAMPEIHATRGSYSRRLRGAYGITLAAAVSYFVAGSAGTGFGVVAGAEVGAGDGPAAHGPNVARSLSSLSSRAFVKQGFH